MRNVFPHTGTLGFATLSSYFSVLERFGAFLHLGKYFFGFDIG